MRWHGGFSPRRHHHFPGNFTSSPLWLVIQGNIHPPLVPGEKCLFDLFGLIPRRRHRQSNIVGIVEKDLLEEKDTLLVGGCGAVTAVGFFGCVRIMFADHRCIRTSPCPLPKGEGERAAMKNRARDYPSPEMCCRIVSITSRISFSTSPQKVDSLNCHFPFSSRS